MNGCFSATASTIAATAATTIAATAGTVELYCHGLVSMLQCLRMPVSQDLCCRYSHSDSNGHPPMLPCPLFAANCFLFVATTNHRAGARRSSKWAHG